MYWRKTIKTEQYTAHISLCHLPRCVTYREYSVHGGSYKKKSPKKRRGGMRIL